jgi:hypothetical protein
VLFPPGTKFITKKVDTFGPDGSALRRTNAKGNAIVRAFKYRCSILRFRSSAARRSASGDFAASAARWGQLQDLTRCLSPRRMGGSSAIKVCGFSRAILYGISRIKSVCFKLV